MNNYKKIPLSLASNYVSNWGLWEACREFCQNAKDAGEDKIEYDYKNNCIVIESWGGKIPKEFLLLGGGSKQDDSDSIGGFGEGGKLAMLVLTRLGYDVDIYNGRDKWTPSFEYSEMFETEHLHINIRENVLEEDYEERVRITINGLSNEELDLVSSKCLPVTHYEDEAEFGREDFYGFSESKPSLYIKGLYVCELEDGWAYSYNLPLGLISLDRDRNAVSGWEIQNEIINLMVSTGAIELISELAQGDYLDVEGYTEWKGDYYADDYRSANGEGSVTFKNDMSQVALKGFFDKYGANAFPINGNWGHQKIQSATQIAISKGKLPVTVKGSFYNMFHKEVDKLEVLKYERITEEDFLTTFLNENKKHIRSKSLKKLQQRLEELKLYKGF